MVPSLARHSDINLTMNVYTDVVLEDQAVAVELLPELPALLPAPATIAVPGDLQNLTKLREQAVQKAGKKSESV